MTSTKRNLLKEKIQEIIFGVDTPWGRFFDVSLLIIIAASILVVMLESVEPLNQKYHYWFVLLEWTFTVVFTIEYFLRLYSADRPRKYASSFFGIIDLLAILPTYLSVFIAGSQTLLVIRALRLIRVFRIFKLGHYMKESRIIVDALVASKNRIFVFLFAVTILVTIIGSLMYLIEGGPDSDFSSIPRSIYWAIVTLTTVGYGDITPVTEIGQFLSAVVMILGYAIIAVPTGIVSAEMVKGGLDSRQGGVQNCKKCDIGDHENDAVYCKFCGDPLKFRELYR